MQNCRCGEDYGKECDRLMLLEIPHLSEQFYEWVWDKDNATTGTIFSEQDLEVTFHSGFSNGTSAVRGTKLLEKGRHHYWEVKILTPVYGTDTMVGVGTGKVDMNSAKSSFCSFLGLNRESYGFSYQGCIQYGGRTCKYGSSFEQGTLVGVHLNTWKGTLEFFLNRKSLGIAFNGLRDTMLYPMMCSTSAQTKMRLTHCSSMPVSLQTECLAVLRPSQREYISRTFPGLRHISESAFADILNIESKDDDDYDLNILIDHMISKKRKRK
ncbi:SPRY domain-containing SOCS box protein 3 [Dufourea novaeangliae]|uniref:SPRY domain-containing SOCS box protein 3 n=2 Tax=Dufourea novaeangliae TaxID=178035 RepID=A0A154P396_DUFNO|nr:SPRY domain-containing SOCS box protein 3 [Dufourea novaeangliae]